MLGSSEDILLWERFKRGDKPAFGKIYEKYAPSLISYGSKVTSNAALIEDSIQDLFVELWKSREKLSSTTSVKFYLFKALRLKIYRNLNAPDHRNASVESHLSVLKSTSQEDTLIRAEGEFLQQKHLKEVLKKLPPRQQEAINLRYFNGFTNEEVAAIMGISYNSAGKAIYAGLKALRENLKEAFILFQ